MEEFATPDAYVNNHAPSLTSMHASLVPSPHGKEWVLVSNNALWASCSYITMYIVCIRALLSVGAYEYETILASHGSTVPLLTCSEAHAVTC